MTKSRNPYAGFDHPTPSPGPVASEVLWFFLSSYFFPSIYSTILASLNQKVKHTNSIKERKGKKKKITKAEIWGFMAKCYKREQLVCSDQLAFENCFGNTSFYSSQRPLPSFWEPSMDFIREYFWEMCWYEDCSVPWGLASIVSLMGFLCYQEFHEGHPFNKLKRNQVITT